MGRGAEYIGMVQFALFCLVAAASFPSNEEIRDRIVVAENKSSTDESSTASNGQTICVFLAIYTFKNFSISSIESATAMLLEEQFGVGETAVGRLLSLTFLLTVPLKIGLDRLTDSFSREALVRLLLFPSRYL